MDLRALVQNLECYEPALVDMIRWHLPDREWILSLPSQEFEQLREQVNIPPEALGVRPLSPPLWEIESNYDWSAHCGMADADEYYKRIEYEDEIRDAKESLSREQFIEVVIASKQSVQLQCR